MQILPDASSRWPTSTMGGRHHQGRIISGCAAMGAQKASITTHRGSSRKPNSVLARAYLSSDLPACRSAKADF